MSVTARLVRYTFVAFLSRNRWGYIVDLHHPSPHVDVEEDDEAGGEVAEDTDHQEDGVDQCDGDQSLIVNVSAT